MLRRQPAFSWVWGSPEAEAMAAEQQAAHGHLAATAARAAACGNSLAGSLPSGKEAGQGQEALGPPGPFTPSLLTPTLRPASAAAPSCDPNPATVAAVAALKAEARAQLLARTAAGPTLQPASPAGFGPITGLPATHQQQPPGANAAQPPSPQQQQLLPPSVAPAQQQQQQLAAVAPFLPPGLAAVLPQILAMPVHAQMPTLQYYLSMVPPASGPAAAPAPAPVAAPLSSPQPLSPPGVTTVQQPPAPASPPQADRPAQPSLAQQSRLQPQQPAAAGGTGAQGCVAVQATEGGGEAPGAAPVSSHPLSTMALQLHDDSRGLPSSLRAQSQADPPAEAGAEMSSVHAAAVLPTGAPPMPHAAIGNTPFPIAKTKPADAAVAPSATVPAAAAAQSPCAAMAPSAAAAGMPPAALSAGEAPSAAAAVATGGIRKAPLSLFALVASVPPTAPAAAREAAQPAEAAESSREAARTVAEEAVAARERPSPERTSHGPPVLGSTAEAQPGGGESCGTRTDSMHAAGGPRLVSSAAS